MTTASSVAPETVTLQMMRTEVNVREFQRMDGDKTSARPGPRHALPLDRVLWRLGPQTPSV